MNLKSKLCCFQDFALRSLRLKPDKWARMVVSDEQRNFINNFVDRGAPQVRQNKYDGNRLVMTLTKSTVYNRLGLSFTWLFTRVFAELTNAIFQKNFAKELVLLVTPRFCVLSKSQNGNRCYTPLIQPTSKVFIQICEMGRWLCQDVDLWGEWKLSNGVKADSSGSVKVSLIDNYCPFRIPLTYWAAY